VGSESLRSGLLLKQVICINWGTKYGPRFINRLYAMVQRNITPPFTFTCFTDNRAGIRSEVLCEDLPPIDVEMPVVKKGIWPKSRLWGPRLGNLSGPVLFMDLDLVVVGSLDSFFTVGDPNDVILAPNPVRPLERLGQTSVFRFPVGKLVPMQERFRANPQQVAEHYVYEQRFVTREAPGGVSFFPNPWVRHFRYHCVPPFPLNYFIPPRLPKDARIVIFPGGILPEHVMAGGWRGSAGVSPLQHIKSVFTRQRKRGTFGYLRHYVRPADWVGEHWRE
jgi:hypothetical protein